MRFFIQVFVILQQVHVEQSALSLLGHQRTETNPVLWQGYCIPESTY
jgi:hypothetical protein